MKRYRERGKGRLADSRYNVSAKGRARRDRNNAKRVEVGDTIIYAQDMAQRAVIKAHILRRRAEFTQRQHAQSRADGDEHV
jgi:hypothetical protein